MIFKNNKKGFSLQSGLKNGNSNGNGKNQLEIINNKLLT